MNTFLQRCARLALLVVCGFASAFRLQSATTAPRLFGDATPLEWSVRLADSEIARLGDNLAWKADGHAKWDYTAGLFTLSLLKLNEVKPTPRYVCFSTNAIGSFINEDGTVKGYKLDEYQLDALNPGKTAFALWIVTGQDRYQRAAFKLRNQLNTQPRTASGGFWHKQKYTQQMWLDGSYMALPFYAETDALLKDDSASMADIAHQFQLLEEHSYDSKSGLFYHGWDSVKQQPWANPVTGNSSNFWGRGEGWLAMALVDTLDYMPHGNTNRAALEKMLVKVCEGVVKHQDAKSGLWWQVLDKPGQSTNYQESTASAMFTYALAKGVNRGYLKPAKFRHAAERGYAGIIHELVKEDPKGSWNLTQCCQVAGLSAPSPSGKARDGSFAYYLSEPIVQNDLKGLGPLILAGVEMQKLLDKSR